MKNNSVRRKEILKKYLSEILLGTVILVVPIMTFSIFAHDVTVNITGRVTNGTCSVSAGSVNKTVYLGSYPATEFSNEGDSSPPAVFTIDLENCGTISHGVEFSFFGTPDSVINDYFKIAPESEGSGVAIEIMDDTKKLIPAGETSKAYTITEGVQNTSLIFYAKMVANGEKVKTGTLSSVVTFQTTYP